MNQRNASMTVIGAGSYGTALAITLARNGHEVVLWGHDPEHIATLERDRCNAAFLPDVPFPDTLHLESDLATALAASRNILVVVPSHVFGEVLRQIKPLMRPDARLVWATKGLEADLATALAASRNILVVVPSHVFGEVLRQIKPLMRPDARLVWATKGLEAETGRLLQDVAREALGDQIPLAVISGPTFAKELAAGLPTAISLASTDQTFADDLQQLLHCGKSFRVYSNPDFIGVQLGGAVKNVIAIGAGMSDGIGFGANARTALITRGTDQTFADDLQQLLHCGKSFRVYSNPDFIGVQLGGAVKNVIAIGAGMSDGIGFGANARTALITRGLAEMSRLGAALGADPATFMGMAGLGDLVLTCTDNQSRNRRFGMMLGQGMDVQSAQEKIGQVVEGYRNTKEVRELAHRFGVEMPITEEIYQVLYCGKNAREAA